MAGRRAGTLDRAAYADRLRPTREQRRQAHEGGKVPVRLCNYVDVYKNDVIRGSMAFMAATATLDEVDRFRLRSRDVLITKDSEAWNDIGVPALVADIDHDVVSGYHLALLWPHRRHLDGGFLFRALGSRCVAHQLHVRANGVTR